MCALHSISNNINFDRVNVQISPKLTGDKVIGEKYHLL